MHPVHKLPRDTTASHLVTVLDNSIVVIECHIIILCACTCATPQAYDQCNNVPAKLNLHAFSLDWNHNDYIMTKNMPSPSNQSFHSQANYRLWDEHR